MHRAIVRFGPLYGIAALLVGGVGWVVLIGADLPQAQKSTVDEIVAFWVESGTEAKTAAWLSAIAAILMVAFGAWVSMTVRERGATLVSITAGLGTVVFAAGQTIDGSVNLVLGSAAGDLPAESVVTLSALTEFMHLPYLAALVLIVVSLSAAASMTGIIPSWLAKVGFLTAAIAMIPHEISFIGMLLGVLWMLAAGIIMYRDAVRIRRAAA